MSAVSDIGAVVTRNRSDAALAADTRQHALQTLELRPDGRR
jgi:hypothetical protein